MKRALLAVAALSALVLIAWFSWPQAIPTPTAAVPNTRPSAIPSGAAEKPEPLLDPSAATDGTRAAVEGAPAPTPARNGITLLRIRTVSKEDGKPLAGVPVLARPRDDKSWNLKPIEVSRGNMHESPTTASDGFAEIEVTPGTALQVTAGGGRSGAGYARLEVDAIPAGETRSVTVELRAAADVLFHGRAVDATTHAPVSGAAVKIHSRATPEGANEKLATDPAGRFSVSVQSWNSPSLTLEAAGYSVAWILPVTGHETQVTALEIVLARPGTLTLHILEQSGTPIEGALISATVPRYELMQPRDATLSSSASYSDETFRAKTDATGTAVLANLPADARLMLIATLKRETLRQEQAPLVLRPGEERELTWRIGTGCRILGTVRTEDSKPAVAQEIWLQPARSPGPHFLELHDSDGRRTTKCDEQGAFTFADVLPGKWLVGPAAVRGQNDEWHDGTVAPWAEFLEVMPDLPEMRVEIQLVRGLTIRGRVEDPDGRPVERAGIQGSRVDTPSTIFVNSAADGSFVMGPLVPGSYRLLAHPFAIRKDSVPWAPSLEVIAPSGSRDVLLRLQRGCVLAGHVVDSITGEAVAAAMVLAPEPGQEGLYFSAMLPSCDVEKGFRIQDLPPATYSLSARTTTGRAGYMKKIALAPGEERTDIQLRVGPGATVNVRYEGPNANGQVALLFDGVEIAMDGIPKGTERAFVVPAGHSVARLYLYPEKQSFDVAVDLTVGAKKELVFDGAWK